MRTLQLAKVAAQAEGLRLRSMAERQTRRAAFGAVACVFLIAFLVAAHIAIGMALVPRFTPVQAVLIVGAGDLALTLLLGAMAAFSKPGKIEQAAYEVGQRAREEIRASLTVPVLIGSAARSIGGRNMVNLLMMMAGRAFRRKPTSPVRT
jgi:hypothetical protein